MKNDDPNPLFLSLSLSHTHTICVHSKRPPTLVRVEVRVRGRVRARGRVPGGVGVVHQGRFKFVHRVSRGGWASQLEHLWDVPLELRLETASVWL